MVKRKVDKKVTEKIYVHLNKNDSAACEVDKGIKEKDRKHHSLTKKKNMISCPDCLKLV